MRTLLPILLLLLSLGLGTLAGQVVDHDGGEGSGGDGVESTGSSESTKSTGNGDGDGDAPDDDPTVQPEVVELGSCQNCHSRRAGLFLGGVHGEVGISCLDCHGGAESHAESWGVSAAPHPRRYPREQAVALCTPCHDANDSSFVCSDRMSARPEANCLDCHSFHELTLELERPHSLLSSHEVVVPSPEEEPDGWGWLGYSIEGSVEVGGRAVSGNSRQFEDNVNLGPGVQLISAELVGTTESAVATVDRYALFVNGWGDPRSSGAVEIEKSGVWSFQATVDRYEDIFDPTSELHNGESVRRSASAELQLEVNPDLRVTAGYQRFEREDDRVLSRYRDISAERFDPTAGALDEKIDLAFIRADRRWGLTDVTLRQSVRWWEDEDDRVLFSTNAPLDDFEDYEARSRAVTPTTDLRVTTEFLDGRLIVDGEALFSYSDREFNIDSVASGVDAGGDGFNETLTADGSARGRYTRMEIGGAYELTEKLVVSLLARYRYQDDESSVFADEAVAILPATIPTSTFTATKSRVRHHTFDVEGWLESELGERVDFAVGYGTRYEDVDVNGPFAEEDERVVHGLLLESEFRPRDDLRLRGELRAFTADDPYTEITPDQYQRGSITLRWQPRNGFTSTIGHSVARTELPASAGSRAETSITELALSWTDLENDFSAGFAVSYRDYETSVDTIAQVSGFPVPFESRFSGSGWHYATQGRVRLLDPFLLSAGWEFADVSGDSGYEKVHAWGSLAWELKWDAILRFATHYYFYDNDDVSGDDFDSTVFELSLEVRF